MYNSTIHDKLEEIKESIELIQDWSKDVVSADDFMLSYPDITSTSALCLLSTACIVA